MKEENNNRAVKNRHCRVAVAKASFAMASAAARALLTTLVIAVSIAAPASVQADTQGYTKQITIRPGDTLSHIAEREMGSAHHAQQLAEINGVEIETILKPGDNLNIPVSLPIRDEYATIIFSKGRVTLNDELVKINDQVRRNDVLETGTTGYASLAFQTGTLINLQPDSVARIVTLHCQRSDDTCVIEMAAERGTLSTDVRRDGDQPTDFRVQTPYASAAVRGTKFDIDADSTGLRIGVTEGEVALTSESSDQLVALPLGLGSASAPGQPLGSPIDLLPAPVFRFIPPRIAKGDRIRWFGLTDTQKYILNIAPEPSGVGIIYDTVVPSDQFVLDKELPTGDFHILLRAVDGNGLLGFIASSPVTIATEDPSIEPVVVKVERENGSYRIEVVEAVEEATGYEIQVSKESTFADPVSVDIDASGVALVRLSSENLFARARVLIDRETVGPYGASTTVNDSVSVSDGVSDEDNE